MTINRQTDHPSIFALLWLDCESTKALRFVLETIGLRSRSLTSSYHLTVYHARRQLPTLRTLSRQVSIDCDIEETRLMVLSPGGENPRNHLVPHKLSLALRLTKRNIAIPSIHELRHELIQLESSYILGKRRASSRNRSAFGARNYQPHIKICGPRNNAPSNLRIIGVRLRAELDVIRFHRFEIKAYP